MTSRDVKAAGLADAVAGGAELLGDVVSSYLISSTRKSAYLDLGLLETRDRAELELWIAVKDLSSVVSVECEIRSDEWSTHGTSDVLREIAAMFGGVVNDFATLGVSTYEDLGVWALLLGLLDCTSYQHRPLPFISDINILS